MAFCQMLSHCQNTLPRKEFLHLLLSMFFCWTDITLAILSILVYSCSAFILVQLGPRSQQCSNKPFVILHHIHSHSLALDQTPRSGFLCCCPKRLPTCALCCCWRKSQLGNGGGVVTQIQALGSAELSGL